MLKGSITALVTPFREGAFDHNTYERLVEWQINEGTNGLVACGTTGEAPTLSFEEHEEVVRVAVGVADGRLPVIAGSGSNSTAQTIMMSQACKNAGADALLIATPYYNKPTQKGLYVHYKAVHDAVDLPIIIYNIPGRTAVDMNLATMLALFNDCKKIIGVKDATGDLARAAKQRFALGANFCQLSGEDITAIGFNAMGGIGCVSVVANVAPKMCSQMQELSLKGDYEAALAIQDKLMPLHVAMFVETNPTPVKYALSLMGLGDASVRPPLVELDEAAKVAVASAINDAGLTAISEDA
jgi:4-hydroxy-tetrahydrodipicolinate synthase